MKTLLIEKAEKWVNKIYSNADHLIRTGYWVRRIYPEASEALIIAAVTHDIERAFSKGRIPPSPEFKGAKWDDPEYNRWHSRRSALFVRKFLQKEGADSKLIKTVVKLISYHEEGGWKEANFLRDADSISFLEINVPYFIARIPKELSVKEVREKFDYMFERIGDKKAKTLASPFYHKALAELEKIN